MARPLDRKRWEKLRDAFLELDGPHTVQAAGAAGVAVRTARKAWNDGIAGQRPIKDIWTEQKARSEAVIDKALESRVRVVADRVEEEWVRAQEVAQLQAASSAGRKLLEAWEDLSELVPQLAERAKDLLAGYVDPAAETTAKTAGDVIDMLGRIVGLGERGVRVLVGVQEALRTHLSDIGRLDNANAKRTKAEAHDTLARAERAIGRAKRRGILGVIDGGDAASTG